MWIVMFTVAALAAIATGMPCEEARLKCAYRQGCGMALQNYLVGCSVVLQGPRPTFCPEVCEHSLVALTSTDEGKALMNCECSDSYCEDQKQRSEICRAQVTKTMEAPVIPCRAAQWVCNADAQCSMAFEYYQRYCKAMFHGKKCTPRCHNSINILRNQEKAAKLKMCKCDGLENYNCRAIQRNMDKLCFHSKHRYYNITPHVDADVPKVIMIGESASDKVRATSILVLVTLLMTWTR